MRVTITGRHMTVTPALRQYLDERLQKLERYGVKSVRGQFALAVEKYRHTAEGVVTVNGRTIQGKVSTREMYASIDRLLDKIGRQLVKKKEKLVDRKLRERSTAAHPRADVPPHALRQVRVVQTPAPELTVEEALEHLQVHASAFLLFHNAVTGRLQAVQQGSHGQIELIDADTARSKRR